MTAERNGGNEANPAGNAGRVLRLAARRGHISEEAAESTLDEVRERLASAGIYDRSDTSIRVVIPDHLLDDDTLAQLARELGLTDDDWLPAGDGKRGGHSTGARRGSGAGFDVFPVTNWDRYEFLEFIGRGGMGDVYKARDTRLNRNVALKFLRRDDPHLVERFTREARAQAKVGHDNLCPVYEVGEVEGHPYIAMKYVAGGSIKEIADLVSLRERATIMVDVADALHAAPQAGLIHRDIKPANILVERNPDGSWRPFVVDFGIAREMDSNDLTVSGMVLGTPAFSAPEQVRGESSTLDRRTDVYGLGATLYWFLTGQAPYAGTYPEIVSGVAQREPEPPHRIDRGIPVDLETIVLKCLEKEQDHRYPTAREVSEDLRRFLGGEPIEARRAGILYKLGKRIRRYPGLTAAALVVLIAFATLGGFSLRTSLRAQRQAVVAQRLTEHAKEIEGLARVAAMLPLHDQTPERAAIRERISQIEVEMARIGSIGDGPGHYALGRGYFALLEEDKAYEHLQRAVDEGYSSPGLSYAIGLVLGKLYQKELWLARRIQNTELRASRIEEIEQDLRDPALTHLRTGSRSAMEAPAYAEALIAFYDGRLDQALAETRQAFAAEEWLYEAKRLEGDILLELGAERSLRGDHSNALEALAEAGDAYTLAADIARSDPSIHEGECGRWIQILEIRGRRGAAVQNAFDSAVAACGRALLIDPERADVHERLSHLYWRWADLVNDRGGEPAPFLANSVAAADRAIELDPESAAAYLTRGGALTVAALDTLSHGEDPRPTLQLAVESFENAIAIDPGSVLAHDDLGYAWELIGRYEMTIGLDPQPSLDRAVASFQRAIELEPEYANAFNNSGIALWRRARYLLRTSGEPGPSLDRAFGAFDEAIRRNPDYAYAYANRGLAGRTLALYQLETGVDPSPALDQAREDLQHALGLNPQIFWAYPEQPAIEILAARRAMHAGISPRSNFEAAAAAAGRALVANPQNAVAYQSAAEVHRWRAEWRLQQNRSIGTDLIEGKRQIEVALENNPTLAAAMVTEATLLVIQAESESDPRTRSALASQADGKLRQALEINPLLARETAELEERIGVLIPESVL
jgi:serine/threonine-protein kinase